MKEYVKMIRPWDVIMMIILVLVSLFPVIVFSYYQSGTITEDTTFIAVISQDNQIIDEITLTGHVGHEVFDIQIDEHEINTIEIKDEAIRIQGATCSDQVCVRTGFISQPGETIICLPHKLVIEIKASNGESEEMIISS